MIIRGTRARTVFTKERGILHSRHSHIIHFIKEKEVGNNIALACFTLNFRNIIMACYTTHLASGETLLYKIIKSGTIRIYLDASAELSIPTQIINPCINLTWRMPRFIKDILCETKRQETMSRRRYTVTKKGLNAL